MNQKARLLRADVAQAENQLKQLNERLGNLIKDCRHNYGQVVYDPIVTEAYTFPGDPPGTMGIDWRGPTHVPREERHRWKRECLECGLVEYTENVKEKIERVPEWFERSRGGAA